MNKKFAGAALCAALAAALAGCGGGDESAGVVPSAAQGLWQGRTSTGLNANVAMLENGEMWGVYGFDSVIYGAVHAQARWDSGQLAGTGTALDANERTLVATSFTGNVNPGSTIALSTPEGVKFQAVYHPAYDDPPSLAAFAGNFRGRAVSPSAAPRLVGFSVAPTGAVTVADAACPGTGTVQPRAGGKNIYDLELTLGGDGCFLGRAATLHGVAYYDGSTNQLLAMALNPARTDGFIYLGIK